MTITTRDRAIKLAIAAKRLPLDGQCIIIDALLFSGSIPDHVDQRELRAERDDRIRRYRVKFHSAASSRAAAAAIDRELRTYESGEWRQHRHLVIAPAADARRQALFEILKLGTAPRVEALRKILAG